MEMTILERIEMGLNDSYDLDDKKENDKFGE